ncbi:MAG: bifunctional diaminohydroxyphosphoribosylaminopyrimidine deaminase/5-amino-6-(5-phosphoribosylamino)uracil reductase RibD [Egibacteraceae bacterium]
MSDDERWMARALALADGVATRTWPNPAVGCVLVRDGAVVGEGATAPPPGAHAEAAALAAAGDAARGATAYVTLEPCAHTGRTPPCADALAAAGVARVVVAVADPNPVAGGGAERLAAAGVDVAVGVGAAAAHEGLAGFLERVAAGRPAVVVKLALSLDGRIAAADGTSQWLTGPATRAAAHRLRAAVDGVVVGSSTVLADDPALTVRLGPDGAPAATPAAGARQPLRVVLDRRARTGPGARVYDAAAASLVVVDTDAEAGHLEGAGIDVVRVDGRAADGGLAEALAAARARGCQSLLVEGGAAVAGAVVAAGLADRLVAHVAPVLLGEDARPALTGLAVPTLAGAPRWDLVDVERVDGDAVLTYGRRAEPAGAADRPTEHDHAPAPHGAGPT